MNRLAKAWKSLTELPPWPERDSAYATKSIGSESIEDQITAYFGGGAAADNSPASPDDLKRAAVVYRCVIRLGNDLASAPIVIEEKSGNDWVRVESGEKNYGDVAGVFERANRYEGSTQMWARFFMGAKVSNFGDSYLFTDYMRGERQNTPPSPSETPKEIHALVPFGVTPVWPSLRQPFEGPTGYRYSMDGAVIPDLRPDEIYRYVNPSPLSAMIGLSPLEAALLDARTLMDAALFQREFFLNGARGSVAVMSEKVFGEEQRNQFRQSWKEDQATLGKRHGIWLLTGGLKVQELNGRKDGDFGELSRDKKAAIAMVFGMPLSFINDYGDSGTRANFEEQTPQYVEGTLEPDWKMVEQGVSEIILPRFVGGERGRLRARFERDKVPMVQRMMLERAKVYETLTGGAIYTPDEAREDLHKEPIEGGDELRSSAAPAMPADAVTADGRMQRPAPPRPEKARPAPAAAAKTVRGAGKFIDTPQRNALRALKAATLSVLERPAVAEVKEYFREREEAILARLPAQKSYATKDFFDDFWDDEEEKAAARDLVLKITSRIASERGPEAQAEAGMEPRNFTIDDPRVVAFLTENAYAEGVLISGTTKELLRRVLAEASAQGITIQQLASEIRDAFGLRRSAALTIARTETVRAHNATSVLAWQMTGLVEKIAWLTAHDDAVRSLDAGDEFDHRAMDGVEVELGKKFTVPGRHEVDHVAFPGDPEGKPGDTINCRCQPVIVPKEADPDPGHTVRIEGDLEKIFAGSA